MYIRARGGVSEWGWERGGHRVGWVNGGGKGGEKGGVSEWGLEGGVVSASFKNPPFLQMVI